MLGWQKDVLTFWSFGAIFVPIYGTLELLQPGSFVNGAGTVFWQELMYYNFDIDHSWGILSKSSGKSMRLPTRHPFDVAELAE